MHGRRSPGECPASTRGGFHKLLELKHLLAYRLRQVRRIHIPGQDRPGTLLRARGCPNADKLTVGILALVAQRERELISERTRFWQL